MCRLSEAYCVCLAATPEMGCATLHSSIYFCGGCISQMRLAQIPWPGYWTAVVVNRRFSQEPRPADILTRTEQEFLVSTVPCGCLCTCHELERPCGNLLPGSCDTNHNRLAPPLHGIHRKSVHVLRIVTPISSSKACSQLFDTSNSYADRPSARAGSGQHSHGSDMQAPAGQIKATAAWLPCDSTPGRPA